jgi:hypothetical protein
MRWRFALAAPALAVTFILSACQDVGTPTELTAARTAPSFVTSSDAQPGQIYSDETPQVGVTGPTGSDFMCVGVFVAGVFDDVLVPPGALCIILNSVVKGNIKALQDALLAVNNTQVGGSIYGDKADAVQLNNNLVLGNIEIAEGGPHIQFSEATVCGTTLPNGNIKVIKVNGTVALSPAFFCGAVNVVTKGNVIVEDNLINPFGFFVKQLDVRNNSVAQNLQVFKNVGTNPKTVQNNNAGESIQCTENSPPFVGGPNTAPKKEGQCF